MLILSRNEGERILIGDDISIMVVHLSKETVRLGIEAPSNLTVVREEVILPLNSESKQPSSKQKKRTGQVVPKSKKDNVNVTTLKSLLASAKKTSKNTPEDIVQNTPKKPVRKSTKKTVR